MTVAPTTNDSFKVRVDGRTIEVDPADFDRFEWRELKAAVGMTQMELFAALAQLDLDAIAGMVWITLRREQPDLVFDDVTLRLSDLYDTGEQREADPPE